jgi:hypothetical protein
MKYKWIELEACKWICPFSVFDVSKPFRLNWDRIISSVFSIGSWYHCNCRLSALKASAHKKVGTYTQTGFNPTQVDSTLELNTLGCWSTHKSQFSLNGFETSKCDKVYAGSMINISSIFAGANFRGSPKTEMFVDIWIRGYYYLHMTCLVTLESLLIVRF